MSSPIKPYSIAELARMYEISRSTISKWLKPHQAAIGPRIGRFYNVLQVKIIFEKLGAPQEDAPES